MAKPYPQDLHALFASVVADPTVSPSSVVMEAMHRARVAGVDACLKICGELDTLGRAEAEIQDYRTHLTGEF